jgi:hypothetical protein
LTPVSDVYRSDLAGFLLLPLVDSAVCVAKFSLAASCLMTSARLSPIASGTTSFSIEDAAKAVSNPNDSPCQTDKAIANPQIDWIKYRFKLLTVAAVIDFMYLLS